MTKNEEIKAEVERVLNQVVATFTDVARGAYLRDDEIVELIKVSRARLTALIAEQPKATLPYPPAEFHKNLGAVLDAFSDATGQAVYDIQVDVLEHRSGRKASLLKGYTISV